MQRPGPALEPQRVTVEQCFALAPEKLELYQGFLIAPPAYPEERRNLLALLLTNVGLLDAVRLAPPERWQEALWQVYGGS